MYAPANAAITKIVVIRTAAAPVVIAFLFLEKCFKLIVLRFSVFYSNRKKKMCLFEDSIEQNG
jgi:hypothetical protein